MTPTQDLLRALYPGVPPPFHAELEAWLRDSRRFRAFLTRHETKVRAKLRRADTVESALDVRAELEVAALLLRDPRFELDYEPLMASGRRGPDFAVTFRTRLPFTVEVRRIRETGTPDDPAALRDKLIAVLWEKAGQMPAETPNLLWLVSVEPLPETALGPAQRSLHQLAARGPEGAPPPHGRSAAVGARQFQQISGLAARSAHGYIVWPNPAARHPLEAGIASAIARLNLPPGPS